MANRRGLSPLATYFGPSIIFFTVQAELAALAQLTFTFEMDGFRVPPDDHTHTTQSSSTPASTTQATNSNTRRDQQDANHLAHMAAATGIAPHQIFSPHTHNAVMSPEAGHLNFHDTGFARGGMSHPQSPQALSTDLSWLLHTLDQSYRAQAFTSGPGLSKHPHPNSPYSNMPTPYHSGAGSSTGSLDIDNQVEADSVSINEEKRRRNTAASARFRIKKKQRTINLQRSISDLTGRAGDLEREVADLRRENRWLKEIVMLKNAQFPPMNHMSNSCQRPDTGPSSSTPCSRQTNTRSAALGSSSDEEQPKAKKEGRKGKTKRKGKD